MKKDFKLRLRRAFLLIGLSRTNLRYEEYLAILDSLKENSLEEKKIEIKENREVA